MWFDEIARSTSGTQIINDSKTPSGRVHVGSLRGVLLHDAIFRALKEENRDVTYSYGIDDFDPLDGLPSDATDEIKKFMGFPLCDIPAPAGSNATDMADHYIKEFLDVFRELGVTPNIYRMRDIYRSGRFNDAIDRTLRAADKVRQVYLEVSNARKSSSWHPFQVVCEVCGRIGTTEVLSYDGKEVEYICQPDMVKWARGCGNHGKVSPFDGRGKLPWKLEWPAKWYTFGITIEGAGKDHCTKGGSRDVSDACFRAIYGGEPPLNVPYEFFLVGGAKMSSSKGIGSSARDVASLLPAEILRFLMIRTPPRRPVNFSSDLDSLVKLFNDYDRLVDRSREGSVTADEAAVLRMSQVTPETVPSEAVNFQLLTALLQLPHIDVEDEIRSRLKLGSGEPLSGANRQRIATARRWLDEFATDSERLVLQASVPEVAHTLSASQRYFLQRLGSALEGAPAGEEAIQSLVFDVARTTPIPQAEAFTAVYKILFARDKGPKVGSILSYLNRDMVIERFGALPVSVADAFDATSVSVEEFERSAADTFDGVDKVACATTLVMPIVGAANAGGDGLHTVARGFMTVSWTDGASRRQLKRIRFGEFVASATSPDRAAGELRRHAQAALGPAFENSKTEFKLEPSVTVVYGHVQVDESNVIASAGQLT